MRLSALSVDLDSLPHYCRIQGVPEEILDDRARSLIATVAIPRLLELAAQHATPMTFFVIGADISTPGMSTALQGAARAGVELASHSFSHDYALSRRSVADIDADLRLAEEAISALGPKPRGFRAPGYTMSPALMEVLVARGYRYDSSAFPATPYYVAKASVMGALSLVGRPSRAILDSPLVLQAPRVPYRPDVRAPYRHGTANLIELPMAVAPLTRIPFIGTFATSMPWPLVEATFRMLRRDVFFNFELHAIDVLDKTDGVPAALVRQQRDLRVPVKLKMQRLGTLLAWLGADRERVTLSEAASRLMPLVSPQVTRP